MIQPTGLAIAADGSFYVVNQGNSGGAGELLRIAAVPEPQTVVMLLAGLGGLGARRRTAPVTPRRAPCRA